MKYSCPKCKSKLDIQKTFNQKIMVSCNSCGLEDLLEYTKNTDEVYLNFLTKFDEGKIPDKKQMSIGLKTEGIIRDEKDIKKMIGNHYLDDLTKYPKKDKPLRYGSHNVDSSNEAISLMALFDHWVSYSDTLRE